MRLLVLSSAIVAAAFAQRGDIRTLNDSLVQLSEKLTPAVVQITSDGYSPVTGSGGVKMRQATGSGFIMSRDGYVVTNAHVVSGATRIDVTLPPKSSAELKSIVRPRGRSMPAKLIGIDRETDIAVLKVDTAGVPVLALADSDAVKQGQIVLALGNPLGLDNSVSMGVVSAVARQLAPDDPVVYIQTDASINPGNSGGPMVDIDGNVIGVNSAILSQSGGSEGIGFAIPSNIVRNVTDQLIRTGAVTRGEIGIDAQSITPALATGLGLNRDYGVVVSDVTPGGPAAFAGLNPGDVILSLDGKSMENARQLQVNLYYKPIHSYVQLDIQRGSERIQRTVAVLERRDDPERFRSLVDARLHAIPRLGFLGVPLDLKVTMMLPGLRHSQGILVASPIAGSTASMGTFAAGDVIYSVNNRAITNLGDLRKILESMKSGDTVVVQTERGGKLRYIEVALE